MAPQRGHVSLHCSSIVYFMVFILYIVIENKHGYSFPTTIAHYLLRKLIIISYFVERFYVIDEISFIWYNMHVRNFGFTFIYYIGLSN